MNRVRLAGCVSGLVSVLLMAGACADRPTDGTSDANPSDESSPPSVELQVEPDSESGWNVHVRTTGFRFAPEHAGDPAQDGEGHAHLYVDDEKVARLYGPWYYLDPADVPAGEHTLRVELNGNDHSPLESDGEPVADETTIDSTGESGAAHEHGHEHGDNGNDGTDQGAKPDVSVDLTIEDGKVNPPPDSIEVNSGDQVRLTIASDTPDTVHVHGYDLEQAVEPGSPAVVEFWANQTGRFEVETHESGLLLTQLLVQ